MLKKANVTQQNQDFEWNSIKWKEVNNMVNNLRQHLYRATEEGDLKKVRNLQKLILRSHSNKLQAIRKVTLQNSGTNTPSIDGYVAISNKERKLLYNKLSQEKEPQSQTVKRVYISKENLLSYLELSYLEYIKRTTCTLDYLHLNLIGKQNLKALVMVSDLVAELMTQYRKSFVLQEVVQIDHGF